MFPSLQDSQPTHKIQIISTTKMPTYLNDSQITTNSYCTTETLRECEKINKNQLILSVRYLIQRFAETLKPVLFTATQVKHWQITCSASLVALLLPTSVL